MNLSVDFTNVFHIVNLVVAVVAILGGISQFFPVSLQSAVIAGYVIIFGLAIGLLEFQVPPQTKRYASFLFSFIGRGVFYIFVGSILLHCQVIRIIAGSIVGLIGVGYVVLEFVPSIEPPENMRLDDFPNSEYENASETV